MPLKLLQINTVVEFNATGRIAEDLGKVVLSKAWKSVIAFGRNRRPSDSELIQIGSNLTFKFHVLQNRLFDNQGSGSAHATKVLIKQIKCYKPDIIHLHNIHGYYINIKLLFEYLAKASVPIVWTLHDCWSFTGHCAYFDFVGCTKWKTGCYECPQKKQYPESWLLDHSKQNYKRKKQLFCSLQNLTIVSVSNWQANLVKQSFLQKYSLQTIHNGVDLNVFNINDYPENVKLGLGISDNKRMLLGVASKWEPRKGFNDFLKLSTLVDENIVIVLVGLNEKQLKLLPANIIGLARTENIGQLAELYSTADLFLNLTYEDNFPTTNLESLACGTPVLTYKTGGSIESVSEDTGFIVEKGDLSGVLEVINNLCSDKKDSYKKACRNRALKNYNKYDSLKRYVDLYEKLIDKL